MARAKKQETEESEAQSSNAPPGMTELMANRDFTLRTRGGHTIHFEEGVPKCVSNKVVSEAMQYGAIPTDPSKMEKPKKDTSGPALQGGDRQMSIRKALEEIVEANNRNDFGANSRPKIEAVQKITGFEVHEKELMAIWESMGR